MTKFTGTVSFLSSLIFRIAVFFSLSKLFAEASISSEPTRTVIPECPSLPDVLPSTSNSKLPDPFTLINGQRVITKAGWQCRRQEISELLQRTQYGPIPTKPSVVDGSITSGTLTINVSENNRSTSFTASITLPPGDGPFPALIALGGSFLTELPGVAIIKYNNDEIASLDGRGRGKFYAIYGSGHRAGPTAAWVWGASRIIDALESIPDSKIDLDKLAVTGCSRNGKGAIAVGAFDSRITLTLPQEAGIGGTACWRLSAYRGGPTLPVETPPAGLEFFSTLWAPFSRYPYTQPVDHHLLASLIAPRGLFVLEHSHIAWLKPMSTWGCMTVAMKVWEALGAAGNMGISSMGGHEHCRFPISQVDDLNAFVDKFLRDKDADTNVVKNDVDDDFGFNEASYVDWFPPELVY